MNYPLLDDARLQRYFTRIGHSGTAQADLPTLQRLHRLHPQAIAFESLESWCGRTPSLVPDDVHAKLVDGRRGGWCFEQNQLFLRVLLTLGFDVQTLSARVIVPDRPLPRTHKVLLVTLDTTRWLVDVGFGGMTMTAPLQLGHAGPQHTPHEPWQLQQVEDEIEVSAEINGKLVPQFRFSLARQIAADYDMANWVVANHPDSRFIHQLIAARPLADGSRYALLDRKLSKHQRGRASIISELASPAETLTALQDCFLIDTAAVNGLQQRIERLFASA